MARVSDLVRDSKLSTHFLPDCTVHTYHESDSTSRRRLVARSEYWQRQRKIGSGAYGSVWLEKRAQDGKADVAVRAVKQISIGGRFGAFDYMRELEAITKFSHPKYERCFVRSFGWYDDPEHLFIAMEYLEMGDLFAYMKERPALPENEAQEVTYQILDALSMMHKNEFAHRDLKPNNILIKSYPPEEWWIKLSDFGISKRVEESPLSSAALQGTPGYMAPEILKLGARGSPYASDMWAAGEIAFGLLTKLPAFANIGLLVNYVMQRDQFPTNTLLDAGVSQLGVDFVFALMQILPADRLTAEVALSHGWIECLAPGSLIISGSLSGEKPNERSTTTLVTEDFAPWNTKASVQPLDSFLMQQTSIANRNQRETITTGPSDDTIRLCKIFDFHRGTIWAISFSLNGRIVAFATDQGHISLWDIEGGVEIRLGPRIRQSSRASHFKTIALSPDGRFLATGTDRGKISVWNVLSGFIIQEVNYRIEPPGVTDCAFYPSGDGAAFALSNGKIAEVSTASDAFGHVGERRAAIGKFSNESTSPYHDKLVPASHDSYRIKALASSHDSGDIVYTSGKRIWVQDLVDGRGREWQFSSTEKSVVHVSADGRYVAFFDPGAAEKAIYVWEIKEESPICGLDISYYPVRFKASPKVIGIAISPKAKILAAYVHYTIYDPLSASRVDTHDPIIFWNFQTGEELYRISKNGLHPFLPMEFSPDGNFFASGSSGAKCEMWTSDISVYFDLLDKGDKEISMWDDLQEELD